MDNKKEIIILGFICFILTIGICIQMNTVNNNGTTISSNPEETELKTQVLKMKERYERQYAELERIQEELDKVREKVTENNGELIELEEKIKKNNLILGNTDVEAAGVVVTLTDGTTQNVLDADNLLVHAENVLLVINELKNAGAEAISVNGKRIVNTTSVTCDGNVIMINGEKISSPIEISAIGLPEQLATLNRAGGTLSYYSELGKVVDLKKAQKVMIPKYTGVFNFKYAKKVN